MTQPTWSGDGQSIYFRASTADGARNLYAVSPAGGQPRLAVRFDDPTKVPSFTISSFRETLYVSVTEYESDIYVMDLEIR